jgi:hypothetical protein
MAITNHKRVGKALELLKSGLPGRRSRNFVLAALRPQ